MYLGEDAPPLPVTQFQVCAAVTLDDAYCVQMLTTLLIMPTQHGRYVNMDCVEVFT